MATPTPVFPAAVATAAQLIVANNLITTTLRVGIDAVNTILFVNSVAGFGPNMLVSIDGEIIAIADTVAAPNAALLVAPGGRGFDGTTPAPHTAGKTVAVLIVAWHHNALATEIEAIEQFLGPNGSNLDPIGALRSTSYDFSPQTPGGSLIAGSNVILLRPVPLGVNGTDVNHRLYISGGTGTAEAVPITGGTAVSGAPSGTVIVNCVNAHSGAWTIRSAAGGVPEALSAMGGPGTVVIDQPATAPCLIHAPVGFNPAVHGQITVMGIGQYITNVKRASDYPNGNLFEIKSCPATVQFQNLSINGGLGTPVTGAIIYSENPSNITFQSGFLVLNAVTLYSSQYGVRAIGITLQAFNVIVYMFDLSFKAVAGISLEGPYTPGVTRPGSNNILQAIQVYCGDVTNANVVQNGLYLNGVDGLVGVDVMLQGDYGLHIRSTSGNYNTVIFMTQVFVDQAGTDAFRISSDGTGATLNDSFTSCHFSGAVAGYGINAGFTSPAQIGRLRFVNTETAQNGLAGIALGAGCAGILLDGGHVLANNVTNANFSPGIYLFTGCSNVIVRGLQVMTDASSGYANGHHKYGIFVAGAVSNITISSNDLAHSSEAETIQLNGVLAGGAIGNNTGVDDTVPTNLFSASFLIPVQPHFIISGSGNVTSVSSMMPSGSGGTLRGSCTFTAGSSIATTITLDPATAYWWYWDGTKIYIK